MVEVALKLYDDPHTKILSLFGNAKGIRQIKRFIKPTTFSTNDNKLSRKWKFHVNSLPTPYIDCALAIK